MRPLGFHLASSLEEALELKATHGANSRFIAGGTDLLVALRMESPSARSIEVIDINRIPKLAGFSIDTPGSRQTNGRVRLGPLVTHSEIVQSPEMRSWAPLLVEAAAAIGSPQIRNRGTVGGNIANAASCADTVPPLIAMDAELTLQSIRGKRTVPLEEAIEAPYETIFADDELLTDIHFMPVAGNAGSAFVKLGRRNALSISRMSIAVIVEPAADETIAQLKVAAGSVVPTVKRFPEVEQILEGEKPTGDRIEAAGKALAGEMIRHAGRRWSTPYKEPVVAALLRRALTRAIARGRR